MGGKYRSHGFDVGVYEAEDNLMCQNNDWGFSLKTNTRVVPKCGKTASTTLIFSYEGRPQLVVHLCKECLKGLAHKFSQAAEVTD